jgi:hypothetical protein
LYHNNKSVSELLCSTNWQSEAVTHKSGFNMTQSVEVMHDFRGPTSDTSFGRTMALGSTQLLTEMSTSKGGRCVGLTTLPPSCVDFLEI